MIFTKPSITSTIDAQIYEVKRALIDQAAKLESAIAGIVSAQTKVTIAEADMAYLNARLATLKAQRESLGEPEVA